MMNYAIIPVEDGLFINRKMLTARTKKGAEQLAVKLYRMNEGAGNFPTYYIAVVPMGWIHGQYVRNITTFHNDSDGMLCKWRMRMGTLCPIGETLIGGVEE